jgi:hypothetical protein
MRVEIKSREKLRWKLFKAVTWFPTECQKLFARSTTSIQGRSSPEYPALVLCSWCIRHVHPSESRAHVLNRWLTAADYHLGLDPDITRGLF